ncbi:hypothetical protein C8R46DRAFT_1189510 [Mycena filopes]|nr:hypothetical protein C8R46DRAFT_1189510 [Mycena filopes]
MSDRALTTLRSSVGALAVLLQNAPSPARIAAILQNALRLAPTAGKYLALLLLLLNAGSLPLVWHFRVFAPVFELRTARRWHIITHSYLPKAQRAAALQAWYEAHLPLGAHPFRSEWAWRSFVGLDDADFNLHMSNSSYAKALDSARFRLALEIFPNVFRCGGWVPLAATHFHFIREIPMLSRYEVRTSIGAWDDKWIWFVSRFVKPPSSSRSSSSSSTSSAKTNSHKTKAGNEEHHSIPTLKTPATPLTNTPFPPGTPSPNGNGANGANGAGASGSADGGDVARALLARAVAREEREPDGALLYTVAVSQLCYKQGRITVPPALVLAANGFYAAPNASSSPPTSTTFPPTSTSTSPPTSSTSTSPSTQNSTQKQEAAKTPLPAHHLPILQSLNAPTSAAMRDLAALYAGGWRAVPPAERWWERAFEGSEGERRGRVGVFVGGEYAAEQEQSGVKGNGVNANGDGGKGGSNGEKAAKKGGLSGGLEGVRGLGRA